MPRFWQVSSPYATPFAPVIPTFLSEELTPWASSRLTDFGRLMPAFIGDEAIVAQPSGGGLWRGNEPSGMTQISDRPFNSKTEDANWDTVNAGPLTIVTDATAPQSPSNVIRETLPFGFAGGTSHGSTRIDFATTYRVFYACFYSKFSSNWQNHLTDVNKQCYTWAGGAGIMYYMAHGNGTGPNATLRPHIVAQGTPADNDYGPTLFPSAQNTRNQWDLSEFVLTGNTAGSANGQIDWYMNGVHVGQVNGQAWTTGATAWQAFEFQPIWGGIGDSVTDPAGQTLDWDHVYISGKA